MSAPKNRVTLEGYLLELSAILVDAGRMIMGGALTTAAGQPRNVEELAICRLLLDRYDSGRTCVSEHRLLAALEFFLWSNVLGAFSVQATSRGEDGFVQAIRGAFREAYALVEEGEDHTVDTLFLSIHSTYRREYIAELKRGGVVTDENKRDLGFEAVRSVVPLPTIGATALFTMLNGVVAALVMKSLDFYEVV